MRVRSTWSRVNALAPILSALVLAAALVYVRADARPPADINEYMAGVRSAIESLPYRIGARVGSDVEPSAAAIQLLAPNKIFQRRYVDPMTGSSASLLIVHCGDVRDMVGHFPPVCYPAHGWREAGSRRMRVRVAGEETTAVIYEFSRLDDLVERRMTSINFFILPGATANFAPDMTGMERIVRTPALVGLGVAQVQIVMDGIYSDTENSQVAAEILPVLDPVVAAIRRGAER